ncbi:hypothetical protein OEA41_001809 [Lepraria neglecta]|uniref:N-acetyltransferase domain-containing protein n=1 Tax=Lepraria neglecta TaxID=209136 RepID=A0AAD9ZBD6_9LECA|nr:hypothetical protein OEA41_001809 [Lepraria neglecta]
MSNEAYEDTLAGIMAYMNSSTTNMSIEIGYVITLPPFQRTHVTTNGVGLLLQYALDPPSEGGLGLRRVEWMTSSANSASIRTAERTGFEKEGLLRWHRVFPGGAAGGKVDNNKEMPRSGQETDLDLLRNELALLAGKNQRYEHFKGT